MGNEESPGCLVAILRLFIGGSEKSGRKNGKRRAYPYHVRDNFLSAAELSFYHVLKDVVGEQAVILSKVGLWDIFYVAQPDKHPGAKPHIDRKHVDFSLCDPQTMQPKVGIELDDSRHQDAERRLRDAEVDLVYETAGLSLLHLSAQRGYNTSELAAQLAAFIGNGTPKLANQSKASPVKVAANADAAPSCPKCGTPMVIRVAHKGPRKGQQFYACPNFPNCQSVIPIK